jgi:nitrite reductase (NADH) small subunit
MKWVRVTRIENIPLRQGRSVKLGGLELAIFNLGGGVRVVENRCPHRGGPLADGIVAGEDVICPLHNWRISLDSGGVCQPQDQQHCLKTFAAKVVNGEVLVLLPGNEQEAAA